MRKNKKQNTQISILKILLKLSIVPSLVTLIWVIYAISQVLLKSDLGFSMAMDEYSKRIFTDYKKTELYKGDIVRGSFKASDNNLGIVLVRFYNFNRISDDELIFRIKEKGQYDWYYQSTHKVAQFLPHKYFTFGFPEIKHANNKTYLFELESRNGKPGNAVAMSEKSPQAAVAYKYYQNELRNDWFMLARFSYKKLINSLRQINLFIPIALYVSTLLLTMSWSYRPNFSADKSPFAMASALRGRSGKNINLLRMILLWAYYSESIHINSLYAVYSRLAHALRDRFLRLLQKQR